MAEESIILKVGINTEDVQKELSAAIKSVADLTEEQKRLTKEIKAGNDADGSLAKQLAQTTAEMEKSKREVKAKTAVLQAATAANLKENATLDQQRQALNTLQKAAAAMTKEQRQMTIEWEGSNTTLEKQIKSLTESIKEQEHAIGDDRRNVGNYTESIQKASSFSKDLTDGLLKSGAAGKDLANGLNAAKNVADAFGKSPLLGILQLVWQAISGNKDAMAALQGMLQKLMAAFKQIEPVLNSVSKVLIDGIMWSIRQIMDGIQWLLEKIDALGKKLGKDWHIADSFDAFKQSVLDSADAMNELSDAEKKAIEDRMKKEKEAADALAKQREEMAKRERTDLENKIHDLEAARDKELEIAGLTAEEKIAIEQYYQDEIKKVRDKAAEDEKKKADEDAEKAAEAAKKKLELRQKALEEFGLEDGETMEQKELRLLQEAREQDLINAEEYEIAKTLIAEKYSKKRQKDIDAEVNKATELYNKSVKSAASSTAAALDALSNLLDGYAESSEEAANAQKAFAFGSILINQAMSVAEGAKGIAAAMAGAAEAAAATGPAAPIMQAVYSAQMVGQVIAMVASVASSIVQAKQIFGQAGKHATGALIPGTYDGKDDVPAWLSKGEVVLNPQQASTALWNMANSSMTGYSYENMAAAMANAVAQMPPPNLAITELADVQSRVTTYNEIASV